VRHTYHNALNLKYSTYLSVQAT